MAQATITPARAARLRAGLTAKQAARAAGITPRYLLACERANDFSYVLAELLAMRYRCRIDLFLPGALCREEGTAM